MRNETLEKDIAMVIRNEGFTGLGFSEGEIKVLQAYEYTTRVYDSNLLVSKDIVWEKNYKAFSDYLKECEVNSFIIANTSTELMDLLHFLVNDGWEILTTAEVERKNKSPWDSPEKGLVIKLK